MIQWIDDALLFASSFDQFYKNSEFMRKQVEWCGRLISQNGAIQLTVPNPTIILKLLKLYM